MAKRDLPRKERKKLKKDQGKIASIGLVVGSASVERIPKGKAAKEQREQDAS